MRQNITAFVSGLVFAIGLVVAGMTQPTKVIGFLDVFGSWDPSLAFVMAGAIALYGPLYPIVIKRRIPLFSPKFVLPTRKDIDPRLVGGAAIFGIGWGLAGYCPGPGLASLAAGTPGALTFTSSLLGGMLIFQILQAAFPSGERTKVPERSPNPS